MKKILITGITGQDGLFLSKNLIEADPNTKIFGVSRNGTNNVFKKKLLNLGVTNLDNFKIYNIDLLNKTKVRELINTLQPTSIFNLSGPSSVYESLTRPNKTFLEITMIFDNLIEAMLEENIIIPFFQASSSEMYGKNNETVLKEDSEFAPQSAYAKAKLENHNKVIELSKQFNIKSGIMFNHESEFRTSKYLFKKVILGAKEISQKKTNNLKIGSLKYERDWTFAGDVSKAMIKIINFGTKSSYIIGRGQSHSIEYLISLVFSHFNLNWKKYVEVDPSLLRDGDPEKIACDPSRLNKELNWKPEYTFENLVERCVLKSMES